MLKSVTDRLLRWRDRVRRRVAIWWWDRPNRTSGPFQDKIVFIRWDAKLGDTIVLSWVFRELKRQRPDLEIVVITGQSFEDLFRRGYGINSVYLAGKRHGGRELKNIVTQLVNSRYVVHLGLRWRPRDIRFVRSLDPEYVVGLDDELEIVNVKLGVLTESRHFSEKLVPWLEQIAVDTRDRRYWIPRLPDAAVRVDQWWPKGGVVGLCPYGASRKRHLTDEQISVMVDSILSRTGATVLLIGRSDEIEALKARLFSATIKQRVLNHSSDNVFELFEQVARCDAVVSVDTAVVHIAVGAGKRLLALYADKDEQSQNFRDWRPNAKGAQCLFGQFDSVPLSDGAKADLHGAVQRLVV